MQVIGGDPFGMRVASSTSFSGGGPSGSRTGSYERTCGACLRHDDAGYGGSESRLLAIVFHVRVVKFKERRLKSRSGEAWVRYEAMVPRWFPDRHQ